MPVSGLIDVSSWAVETREPAGSGENVWLRDRDGETWLFKPNRVNNRGQEEGEDWAEQLAHDVARLLDVPSATVEMALRRTDGFEERGAASKNLITVDQRADGWELQLGSVLLTGTRGFHVQRSDGSGRPARDHVGHTVTTVTDALRAVEPPRGAPSDLEAVEVFAGYLVLDALIGNQDRHEENWGLIIDADGDVSLAPSFDHAASLGFQLTDRVRTRHLRGEGGIETFAARGCGRKFEGGGTPLIQLAEEALACGRPSARRFWLDRLDDTTDEALGETVAAVPRMSEVAHTFCRELLQANRRRLLDVCR